MDNLRFILVVSLSLVMLILWQEWEKDYGSPVSQEETTEIENGETRSVDVPAAPVITETQRSVFNLDIDSSAPISDEEQIVVKTDLSRINIGKKGGGVDKLELLKFPVALETPDIPTLLLNNKSPLYYIVQGGLLSENGGPTHEATFTASSNNYVLGEFLAKSSGEIEALESEGIIGYEPVGREAPSTLSLDDMKRQGRILDYETDARDQLTKEYGI